jgi:hypothetical protein
VDYLTDEELAKLPGMKEHIQEIRKFFNAYNELVKKITRQDDSDMIKSQLKTVSDLITTLDFFTETLSNIGGNSYDTMLRAFEESSQDLEDAVKEESQFVMKSNYKDIPEA